MAKLGIVCHGVEKETVTKTKVGNQNDADRNGGAVLFSQAAREWLVEISSRRKYSTYIKYDTVYRTHLANTIDSCWLSASMIQELHEKIFDHLSGGGMSESLQKSVICVTNQILAFANRHYLTDIPMLKRLVIKAKKKTNRTFSRAEQALLLECIYRQMDKFKAAVLLCFYTGLRLGELCALRWADIDFEEKTLSVNRTVQRIAMPGHKTKTILLETNPKSESSKRTIPLTSELLLTHAGLTLLEERFFIAATSYTFVIATLVAVLLLPPYPGTFPTVSF